MVKMKEFSSSPLYTGNEVKFTGAVEDRVNLWPVAYYREPVGSLAWPLISWGDDHLAFRPLYSQYKQSGDDYDEFNFLWPISQFDTKHRDYRVFPLFWGEKPLIDQLPEPGLRHPGDLGEGGRVDRLARLGPFPAAAEAAREEGLGEARAAQGHAPDVLPDVEEDAPGPDLGEQCLEGLGPLRALPQGLEDAGGGTLDALDPLGDTLVGSSDVESAVCKEDYKRGAEPLLQG